MVSADANALENAEDLPNLHEMYEQLQDLQQTVDAQQEVIESQQATIDAQQKRIDELEGQIDFVDQSVDNLEDVIDTEMSVAVADSVVKKHGGIVSWLESLESSTGQSAAAGDAMQDLREDLINEQRTRSKADANIERKLHTIADETNVDVDASDVAGEDKIVRLLKHGPEDITDTPYPVHERARTVLEYAGKWGKRTNDQFGTRITFRGPAVREKLELERNENLQSKQVRDVFEKLEELGQDSPRKVSFNKADDGVYKLQLQLTDEEMSR